MPVYPGAVRRLIPHANTENVRSYVRNRINFHTAVTDAASLYSYFSQPGNPCSHFYVAENGTVEQYIDTDFYSAADYEGNDTTISIETWDGYGRLWTSGQPPAWTPAQIAALRSLTTWIIQTHRSIPTRLATDSRVGETSRGLSWHRLGVESSPPFRPGYRVDGGMYYSTVIGKTCPGDARIAQIPGILAAIPPMPPLRPTHLEDTMLLISDSYRARGVLGVLALGGGWIEIRDPAELANLRSAGIPLVPVNNATIDELIHDARGRYWEGNK